MLLIIWALVFGSSLFTLIASILVAGLTLYSGIEYFWKLRDLFIKDLGINKKEKA